jgi:ribosomal protein S27E
MADPYAYLRWVCSECDSEPVAENADDYDIRCEVCGHTFRETTGGYAEYVPDPDDLEDEDVA